MNRTIFTKLLSLIILPMCIVACGEAGTESSSSSSSSSSTSSTSSSSSGGYFQIRNPLDTPGQSGLLPYVWGGGDSRLWGSQSGSHYQTAYAAIDAGSNQPISSADFADYYSGSGQRGGLDRQEFSADQYYTGGQVVDRNALADHLNEMYRAQSYRGIIFKPSRTARTGKFVYEIPIAVDRVAIEIHIVPFHEKAFTDIGFSLKVESLPRMDSMFAHQGESLNRVEEKTPYGQVFDSPILKGFIFTDVAVADGSLTLEFDLPVELFGVSAIFVADNSWFTSLDVTDSHP